MKLLLLPFLISISVFTCKSITNGPFDGQSRIKLVPVDGTSKALPVPIDSSGRSDSALIKVKIEENKHANAILLRLDSITKTQKENAMRQLNDSVAEDLTEMADSIATATKTLHKTSDSIASQLDSLRNWLSLVHIKYLYDSTLRAVYAKYTANHQQTEISQQVKDSIEKLSASIIQ